MAEYTYADVIIDPEDPRVEIGKEYYMADYPQKAIARANARGDSGVLKSIDKEQNETPFVIAHKVSNISWACIIRKETSYRERQAEWVRQNDIHAGSWVKILRAFSHEEQGCSICYGGPDMDCLVGKTVEVRQIADRCICIWDENHKSWWNWPYFVLEKAEKPEPEYVPFDLSKEEDRLKLCGLWVKSKRHPDECHSICGVSSHLVFISGLTPGSNAKEFLRDFTFLDGSPCGRPANKEEA